MKVLFKKVQIKAAKFFTEHGVPSDKVESLIQKMGKVTDSGLHEFLDCPGYTNISYAYYQLNVLIRKNSTDITPCLMRTICRVLHKPPQAILKILEQSEEEAEQSEEEDDEQSEEEVERMEIEFAKQLEKERDERMKREEAERSKQRSNGWRLIVKGNFPYNMITVMCKLEDSIPKNESAIRDKLLEHLIKAKSASDIDPEAMKLMCRYLGKSSKYILETLG